MLGWWPIVCVKLLLLSDCVGGSTYYYCIIIQIEQCVWCGGVMMMACIMVRENEALCPASLVTTPIQYHYYYIILPIYCVFAFCLEIVSKATQFMCVWQALYPQLILFWWWKYIPTFPPTVVTIHEEGTRTGRTNRTKGSFWRTRLDKFAFLTIFKNNDNWYINKWSFPPMAWRQSIWWTEEHCIDRHGFFCHCVVCNNPNHALF